MIAKKNCRNHLEIRKNLLLLNKLAKRIIHRIDVKKIR